VNPRDAARLGRRRFLQGLGTAGVTTAFGTWVGAFFAGDAGAQGAKTPPSGGSTPPTPPATPPAGATTPPPPPTPEARAEADAWLAILRARVGEHMQAADEPSLREELLNAVPSSKTLRAKTLANGVDPDTIFRAKELDT
jgi:hypothetical protein